jgi:hypothetical protein
MIAGLERRPGDGRAGRFRHPPHFARRAGEFNSSVPADVQEW